MTPAGLNRKYWDFGNDSLKGTMNLKPCFSLVLSIVLACPAVPAESKPVDLKWSELGPLVTGHFVELTTKDGVKLAGDVVSVRPDALVLDAKRTSDAKLIPKGGATLPRASIDTLLLIRTKGRAGRAIGTTLGVVSGLTLGSYAAVQTGSDSAAGVIATFLVVAGVTTVAGHFIGRAADRKVTTIHITQ